MHTVSPVAPKAVGDCARQPSPCLCCQLCFNWQVITMYLDSLTVFCRVFLFDFFCFHYFKIIAKYLVHIERLKTFVDTLTYRHRRYWCPETISLLSPHSFKSCLIHLMQTGFKYLVFRFLVSPCLQYFCLF